MAGKYLSFLIHFVWSTKNREPWIAPEWSDNLNAENVKQLLKRVSFAFEFQVSSFG